MIPSIALLLTCQLAGELAVRALALPLPGPVLGMALLLAAFLLRPALAERVGPTARGLLAHLSLLFVPAGVGVVSHLDRLAEAGTALLVALVASTLLTLAVTAAVFAGLSRLLGGTAE